MRHGLRLWATWLALIVSGSFAVAQAPTFPANLVRIVVPFQAGSGTDTLARILGEELGRRWGKPVIVENRPGASGQIGTVQGLQAAPDGHTLIMSSSATHSANPALFKTLNYEPVAGFRHVAPLVQIPFALATTATMPFSTPQELIAYGRANPGKLNYGYGTPTSQVAAATLLQAGKFEAVAVPYRSQPPALTDLVSGQIQFMFADLSVVQPFTSAGSIRAIAIAAPERNALMPDVPTLQELGFNDFSMVVWVGISAHPDTAPALVDQINADITAAMAKPEVNSKLTSVGMAPFALRPPEFTDFVRAQLKTWGEKIVAAELKAE